MKISPNHILIAMALGLILWASIALGLWDKQENQIPSPSQQLVAAVCSGDLEGVKQAIAQAGSLEAVRGSEKYNPVYLNLELACNPNLPVIKYLVIEKKQDIHQRSGHYTILTKAMVNSPAEILQFLVEQGADVNATAKDGTTPLMMSASYCYLEHTQILLQAGADPYRKDKDGRTAIDSVLNREPILNNPLSNEKCRKYDDFFREKVLTTKPNSSIAETSTHLTYYPLSDNLME
ncbi:ankyrin repeat domain-containing protein [Thiofilum flexile]|uniref:ankyrin repeat domain-containing protein n=1 Tax=Thiofilum flexile TaxID=125627 RepID=UPI00037E5CA9|nr:ankyrin repeat domain-containing protein [Thiofilum flexile]